MKELLKAMGLNPIASKALPDTVCFLDIKLQRSRHGRGIWEGCFYVKDQPGITYSFGCSRTKRCNAGVILLKVGKVYEQRVDPRRTEEREDIVEHFLEVGKISRNGVVDDPLGIVIPVIFQEIRDIIFADI